MKRGDLYRVRRPGGDPRRARVFVLVSRQVLIDSRHATVNCAPVFARGEGLATQVQIDERDGLRHRSWIMCDNLVSLPKAGLTDYVGSLPPATVRQLDDALRVALALAEEAGS